MSYDGLPIEIIVIDRTHTVQHPEIKNFEPSQSIDFSFSKIEAHQFRKMQIASECLFYCYSIERNITILSIVEEDKNKQYLYDAIERKNITLQFVREFNKSNDTYFVFECDEKYVLLKNAMRDERFKSIIETLVKQKKEQRKQKREQEEQQRKQKQEQSIRNACGSTPQVQERYRKIAKAEIHTN